MDLVIASQNLHKVREFREMLKAFPWIDVRSLRDYPAYTPEVQTGTSFKDNAIAKAIHAAKGCQTWVLADDCGIVIPSLGNPPHFSSGDESDDAESRQAILRALQGRCEMDRSAYLECALAIANADGLKKYATGTCEGVVVDAQRGRNGFGYDAIFCKNDYDKTLAELDETVKMRVSDRRKAFEKLALFLETLAR